MVAGGKRAGGRHRPGAVEAAAVQRLLDIPQIDALRNLLPGFRGRESGGASRVIGGQHGLYPGLRVHQHADGVFSRPAGEISFKRTAFIQQQGRRNIFPGINAGQEILRQEQHGGDFAISKRCAGGAFLHRFEGAVRADVGHLCGE